MEREARTRLQWVKPGEVMFDLADPGGSSPVRSRQRALSAKGARAAAGRASSCSGRPGRPGASWWWPGVAVLLAQGWFQDLASARGDGVRAAAAACLVAVLVAKIAGRLRTSERRRSAWRESLSDIELGLLLLTATYVFLAALGGVSSPVFPLVYALVSFLVTFHRLGVGLPLALAAIALEAAMAFGPGRRPRRGRGVPRPRGLHRDLRAC